MAETTRDCALLSLARLRQLREAGNARRTVPHGARRTLGRGRRRRGSIARQPAKNEPTALPQVEFYLSDKNLRRDAFYRARIEASEGGWLPLAEIPGAGHKTRRKRGRLAALAPSTSVELRIDAEIDADGGGRAPTRRSRAPAAGGGGGEGWPKKLPRFRSIAGDRCPPSRRWSSTTPRPSCARAARFEAAAARWLHRLRSAALRGAAER